MHQIYMHHGYIYHGYMYHIMDTCIMDTSAWVIRPERPKGAKDEVKEARRAADLKLGPDKYYMV